MQVGKWLHKFSCFMRLFYCAYSIMKGTINALYSISVADYWSRVCGLWSHHWDYLPGIGCLYCSHLLENLFKGRVQRGDGFTYVCANCKYCCTVYTRFWQLAHLSRVKPVASACGWRSVSAKSTIC